MLKVTHQPRWFAIGAFFVFKALFNIINGELPMNPKRQVIEQAIYDLEENIKTMEQIYHAFLSSRITYAPHEQRKELHEAMKETFYERENIANRLFHDWTRVNPNSAYYDPNPTPVFNSSDFHRSKPYSRKPLSFPVIVDSKGKRA